jgi:hypothetical protein
MPSTPISVDLSRLLLAFTIELDNEFERRMSAALPERPFRVSAVMWSNFLRFVESGIPVGELPAACGLPKARVLSTLGGMERWGYVSVDSGRARQERRDGYGSARGLKADWVVRPTAVGVTAQEIWPADFAEIERRWGARFGGREVAEIRGACSALADGRLPEYLPIVAGTNGMVSEIADEPVRTSAPVPLSALLARVLLAYTLAFEREAPLSLPLAENVGRVLTSEDVDVREVPVAAAVSREAVSMSLTYLVRQGLADGTKIVRLTDAGLAAKESARASHGRVARAWAAHHGRPALDRLHAATRAILEQRDGSRSRLTVGLEPHPDGWRASGRYLAQTERMLADPFTGLPRHPMVLHRGGWPDGS